jgi:hypothetical protein
MGSFVFLASRHDDDPTTIQHDLFLTQAAPFSFREAPLPAFF